MSYISNLGLYTDESPGLKVDPVVVLVLSLGFIFSVVALHSMYNPRIVLWSHTKAYRLIGIVLTLRSQSSPRSLENSHRRQAGVPGGQVILARGPTERCGLCKSTGACDTTRWMKWLCTHGYSGRAGIIYKSHRLEWEKREKTCNTIVY